ncbi:YDG domain-containing protein [Acinetobacter sp.]|uniref:YDG domain-containing protein n=1 Tax=Acinetobacter sp. TaxID=472 RepID=UPI003D079F7B
MYYSLVDVTNGGLATNYSLATGTATGVITAAPLSIASPTIASKVYDGTATAGAVTTGTLSGFVGTETVTTTAVAANYSSANVGTYNGVVVAYTLVDGTNGGLATNYSLATGTATGVITTAPLSITSPTIASMVYDGTATAGAVTTGTLSGFVGTETVTTTAVAADYSSANVGTYNGVVVTYTLVDGTNGGLATNYSLANGSADGEITAKALTITANDAIKGYGVVLTSPTTGSTAFTVGAGELLNSDAVSSVTLTYLNDVETGTKAVGSYASNIEPSAAQGTGLSNYSITYTKGSMTIYEVIVEATAGTILAGYNTMKAAYDAINAGAHTGVIVVKVYANTTETATATLNDSGVGSASYDSVTIQAMAGVTISGSASPVMILGQEAVNP